MPNKKTISLSTMVLTLLLAVVTMATSAADKKYAPGISDTEIKIGNTSPYSGPASAYGVVGKALRAYFDKVNADGGINGRKIIFLSLDDGYSPPKTKEQFRKLVEREKVALIFQPVGTPTNAAVQRYMNRKKVPQLFVGSGASRWGQQPEKFPWTMGWTPTYRTEGRIYGEYLLKNKPDARIGILYQNDDYGGDYVQGLKDALGEKAGTMIVAEESYEVTDPTIDSQIVNLKAAGADTFYDITIAKFSAQAIRKAHDIGWKPLHILNSISASISAALAPAGLEKSKDIVTAAYLKDAGDPAWRDDPAYRAWLAWMDQWYPQGNKDDYLSVYAYAAAETLMAVLQRAGDNLTRENIMKQAASLKNVRVGMLLPGITVTTSPDDYYPIEAMQMKRFDGTGWVRFGEVIGIESS